MAKRKLTEKQKQKLRDSEFARSNSSDLTINPSWSDSLEYDDDGSLSYDRRTKEGKKIDKILKSKNRSSSKNEEEDYEDESDDFDDDSNWNNNSDNSDIDIIDSLFDDDDDDDDWNNDSDDEEDDGNDWNDDSDDEEDDDDDSDDEENNDEKDDMNSDEPELYKRWKKDPASTELRSDCEAELKDARSYNEEEPGYLNRYLQEMEELDSDFGCYLNGIYERLKEAEDEINWTEKDYRDYYGDDYNPYD